MRNQVSHWLRWPCTLQGTIWQCPASTSSGCSTSSTRSSDRTDNCLLSRRICSVSVRADTCLLFAVRLTTTPPSTPSRSFIVLLWNCWLIYQNIHISEPSHLRKATLICYVLQLLDESASGRHRTGSRPSPLVIPK